MFDSPEQKNKIMLIGISVLCFINFFYLTVLYFKWDNPSEAEPTTLEINLPVINWGSYSDLSKQYDSATIEGDNL